MAHHRSDEPSQYPGAHWRKPKSDLRGRRTSLFTDGTGSASKDGSRPASISRIQHLFCRAIYPNVPTPGSGQEKRYVGRAVAFTGLSHCLHTRQPRGMSGSAIEPSGILHKAIPRSRSTALVNVFASCARPEGRSRFSISKGVSHRSPRATLVRFCG